MTTSNNGGENKATKKPPPRPAMCRRHSFDICSLPSHASPASSPPRPPESSPPTTPNKCSTPTKMMSFPELLPRSRRHTMSSNFDGGYARYDEASGKMKLSSPPPPPSRKRQSISVGDVSGLLMVPPPSKMTGQESKKVAEKDTSNPSPQQDVVNNAPHSSGFPNTMSTATKLPAMMPPPPPFEDDDQDMEDIPRPQDHGPQGGNVRYGRRMSIGSILGPIVADPPKASAPDSDATGRSGGDVKKPSEEGDSTTLLSLQDLHVSSTKSTKSSHQGPSPRSSAVI